LKSYYREYTCLFLFILLMSLFLVSCKKDDHTVAFDSTEPGSGTAYMAFRVNGVAMDCSQYSLSGFYFSTTNKTYISISPNGVTYFELNFGFSGKASGTFTETTGAWLNYTDEINGNYYYAPNTCSITVTQYGDVDYYIVGTFSATKTSSNNNTATITEGKFSVKRTY
jgi:hypothetical protein